MGWANSGGVSAIGRDLNSVGINSSGAYSKELGLTWCKNVDSVFSLPKQEVVVVNELLTYPPLGYFAALTSRCTAPTMDFDPLVMTS